MPVSIIIPVFNKVEYTKHCIEALIQYTPAELFEVIIVNNASTDGTKDFLNCLEGDVKIITNNTNLGFARACNQGARAAGGKYLLFLNNDTEPQPGWLKPLVSVLDNDSSVAAVGSKLLFPDGTIQHAGVVIFDDRRLNDPLFAQNAYVNKPGNLPEANRLNIYQALTAACLMIRKSAFDEAGGFDEGYWNGYEDVDLCFKLQEKGWKLVYQPESVVIHHESKSGTERFSKVKENINRLHKKWLNKIKPDIIIEKDGSVKETDAGRIQPYFLPKEPASVTQSQLPEIQKGLTSIIILTHNQLEHTKLCLESIQKYTSEPHEIIFVDNGSTDGTVDYLKTEMAGISNIRVILNKTNRGFAAGNNQGIALARGEFLLLLNNDTIVTEGWLGRMLDVFKRHPETGIVGPMSNYVSGQQWIADAASHYKNNEELNTFAVQWRKEHAGQGFPYYRAVGFCLLSRREVFDTIGGLDEKFAGGNFEDDDFCIRAAFAGYGIRIAQDVFIHHTGRQSFKGASINYSETIARNWYLLKDKWRLAFDAPLKYFEYMESFNVKSASSADAPSQPAYRFPLQQPSGSNLFVSLPDVFSDHRADGNDQWLKDISKKEDWKQKIQEKEKKSQGLTSIIVTTAQESDSIKKCIESLRNHTTGPHEIIVVSYGKHNKTSNWLRKKAGKESNLSIIDDGAGRRYAEACNLGIRTSKGQYIVLIMDNVVVTQGWLSSLTECLQSSPDIGIVGPMTTGIDGPQAIKNFQIKDREKLDEFAGALREKNRYRRVIRRTLHGFCLLFERDLCEKIGMFGEQFLTSEYAIDDYCLMAALEDYKSYIACDSFVDYHDEHALPDSMNARERTLLHNRELFQDRKYFGDKWSNTDLGHDVVKKLAAINALSYSDELRQKGQKNDAVAILIEGIKNAQEEKALHFTLVELLIENKQIKDAMAILEHMPVELKEDIRWMELTGSCKESLNLNEEADRYADEILASNEASPKAFNLKGVIAYKKKLLGDAEKYFRKALELDRRWGEPYSNLGSIKWNSGNYEEALDFFEKAFVLLSTDENILHNFHAVAVSLSRLERVERALESAVALFPSHKKLRSILIDVLIQENKYQEAIICLEEAMRFFGIDSENLSRALDIRGKTGPKEIGPSAKGANSLCMIVKNEEKNIGRCLDSISPLVDEMIVVDTGSTDKTKDIAKAFGAKVYDFAWTDNFSEARNFSLSKASGDWILVLDADEVIAPSDHKILKNLLRQPAYKSSALTITTRNYVAPVTALKWTANDGSYIKEEAGTGWYPSRKVRIFPNNPHIRFELPVHEFVEFSLQKAGIRNMEIQIPVHHYGKLDRKKITSKGDDYYPINKAKLSQMGEKDFTALYELAVQASELERFDEALQYWKRLSEVKPDFPKAYFGMADSYYRLRKYEEAFVSIDHAIKLGPDSPEFKEMVNVYASAALCTGRAESGIPLLKKVLQKYPEYPMGNLIIAMAFFCMNQKEEGNRYWGIVQKMNLGHEDYVRNFVELLLSAERPGYALSLIEGIVDGQKDDARFEAIRAQCQQMLKDKGR